MLGHAVIRRWPFGAFTSLDLTASARWPEPHVEVVPAADEGLVLVEVEYRIDPAQAREFSDAIQELSEIRRRGGALTWSSTVIPLQAGRYVEIFMVESWVEHLR
jgi:transmembrane secretion effector